MEFSLLATERVKLIQIGLQHVEPYFNIMSQDKVTMYYGMDSIKSTDEAVKIIESFQQLFEANRGIRWGILEKESGTFIGTVGLNNLNKRGKKAEVGYELHPHFWGKGITSEVVCKVLEYSFFDLGLFRMGAVTYPQNYSSIRVLEKLGFQYEGRLRGYLFQGNQSHDALIFSLLKTEWVINSIHETK